MEYFLFTILFLLSLCHLVRQTLANSFDYVFSIYVLRTHVLGGCNFYECKTP